MSGAKRRERKTPFWQTLAYGPLGDAGYDQHKGGGQETGSVASRPSGGGPPLNRQATMAGGAFATFVAANLLPKAGGGGGGGGGADGVNGSPTAAARVPSGPSRVVPWATRQPTRISAAAYIREPSDLDDTPTAAEADTIQPSPDTT